MKVKNISLNFTVKKVTNLFNKVHYMDDRKRFLDQYIFDVTEAHNNQSHSLNHQLEVLSVKIIKICQNKSLQLILAKQFLRTL